MGKAKMVYGEAKKFVKDVIKALDGGRVVAPS
jgi:hypothetical protein